MGRVSTDTEEREAKLRELEAELDSELGIESSTVEVTRRSSAKATKTGFGHLALYSLGAFVLAKVLGLTLVNLIAGVSFIGFIVFGILWLIGLLKGED